MQPILYLDYNNKFPATNEMPGYWVGWKDCAGDALTFKILTADMKTVLIRSVVRAAEDEKHRN